MTMPTPLCPWRMQVHHIHQETPDVWTLLLICHDYYPYRAGQYALVSIGHQKETLRAYTLSSTPGVSEFITLTVRRIENGAGSNWLTQQVKRGDYLWLSDAQGTFTCDTLASNKLLLLAAGCGVTPVMSMRRWLAAYRPDVDVQVIYSVRSPQDVIFADEWQNYPVTLVAESQASAGFTAGRLTQAMLSAVPDLTERTLFCCGPAPYMEWVEHTAREMGVLHVFKEPFFTPAAPAASEGVKLTKLSAAKTFFAAHGDSLLQALESNQVAVNAACREGVCGCCKTQVLAGEYSVSSTLTLTDQEIAEGYVLACSCQPLSDLVVA
ncbi:NADH oxidoreductase [Pantoea rwandensis]|uniref:NADH oxidoreductase n=1 Tax=Pantoea rwandensis TaxID=1076550 RepID=A0A1X1CM97_9GAMM|nr:NADH oxidoreductase [Pantoea rwandensis]ORM65536.1 NADH oxidoreductase [Pantoea rwandensis]